MPDDNRDDAFEEIRRRSEAMAQSQPMIDGHRTEEAEIESGLSTGRGGCWSRGTG